MKTTLSRTALVALIAIFLSAAGCGKQAVSDSRASRLTADENYRLKKQIDQLNQQLAASTKNIEQAKQQHGITAAAEKQVDQLNKQLAARTKELEQCNQHIALLTQENQQLKNTHGEAAANMQTLTEQLAQCQKELASPADEYAKKMIEEAAKTKKEAEESVNFVMTTVREEGEKEAKALRDENESLKAQIQKLQDELTQLKK